MRKVDNREKRIKEKIMMDIASRPPPKRRPSSMPTSRFNYEFMVVVLSTLNPLNILSLVGALSCQSLPTMNLITIQEILI